MSRWRAVFSEGPGWTTVRGRKDPARDPEPCYPAATRSRTPRSPDAPYSLYAQLTLEVGGLCVRAQCAQGPATLASGLSCLAHTHCSWRDRDRAPAGPGSLRRYTGRVFQGARASRSERSWGSAAKAECRSWQPMKMTTSATESSSRKKSSR